MRTITVATFNQPEHAELLRRRFQSVGIQAVVHDQSKLEKMWFVSQPIAGVRLDVPEKDFETALQQLKVWDETEHVLRDAVRCPECKSSRIEYPQFTRKFLMPNLIGIVSALGFVEKEYYCQDCQYTWPSKENNKPPKPNPHGAPNYFIEGVPPPKSKLSEKS